MRLHTNTHTNTHTHTFFHIRELESNVVGEIRPLSCRSLCAFGLVVAVVLVVAVLVVSLTVVVVREEWGR